jgi:hypothetical protein
MRIRKSVMAPDVEPLLTYKTIELRPLDLVEPANSAVFGSQSISTQHKVRRFDQSGNFQVLTRNGWRTLPWTEFRSAFSTPFYIPQNNKIGLVVTRHQVELINCSNHTANWRTCLSPDGRYRHGRFSLPYDPHLGMAYIHRWEPWAEDGWFGFVKLYRMFVYAFDDILVLSRQYPTYWPTYALMGLLSHALERGFKYVASHASLPVSNPCSVWVYLSYQWETVRRVYYQDLFSVRWERIGRRRKRVTSYRDSGFGLFDLEWLIDTIRHKQRLQGVELCRTV